MIQRSTLIEEFREVLLRLERPLPVETDAIMVLAIRPDQDEDGYVARHDTPENRARIGAGVDLALAIEAARWERASAGARLPAAPLLILNGEDEQFPMMIDVALEFGARPDRLLSVACGPLGRANTRTQFEVLHAMPWLADIQHLTIITTAYHVPRVRRTARANLPEQVQFEVLPAPYAAYPFNLFKIRSEIARIRQYAARGDIAVG
jgi:hypothetical protein